MDIITLLLFYLLMQKPELLENLKPLFGAIKSPEDLTKILNDVHKFKDFFAAMNNATSNASNNSSSNFSSAAQKDKSEEKKKDEREKDGEKGQEKSQSPTAGIANEFIQNSLDAYFKRRKNG
jgi:hypothetical protein